jgi:hypothetical protein
MSKPPFDISAASRADALAALDEPENNPNLAKLLHEHIRAFRNKLQQGGRRVRLMVKSDFEQVAAEALVKSVSEAEYDDGRKPPIIEIVRMEKSGLRS